MTARRNRQLFAGTSAHKKARPRRAFLCAIQKYKNQQEEQLPRQPSPLPAGFSADVTEKP
jgi:hypothetical protein